MNQFSQKISEILAFCREEASRLSSQLIAPEHMLLAILRGNDNTTEELFAKHNIDCNTLKKDIEEKMNVDLSKPATPINEIFLNDKANNILKLAVLEARLMKSETVEVYHLLLAIMHDQSGNLAKDILEENNMTYKETLDAIMQKTATANDSYFIHDDEDADDIPPSDNRANGSQKTSAATATKGGGKTPVTDKFSTDLTQAALEGKLDPVVGREKEIQRLTEILCRRKKNNPVLIGEPGVGKSAIVEGLAQLIAAHKTSPVLFGKRIVSLDLTGIVAGTKYRGQFEERIQALIRELEQNPDIIIFIDEIHTIVGAGSAPGSMDAANIMKPALSRGKIQCIGATTLDEYRNSIEKDGALERRFQKIVVNPTTEEETLQILRNIKDRYESYHRVTYSNEAIAACVKLTGRYIGDRQFPDKAIDALDETGAHMRLANAVMPPSIAEKEKAIAFVKEKKQDAVRNQNFELAASFRDRQLQLESELDKLNKQWQEGDNDNRPVISADDVAAVISLSTGIPVGELNTTETLRLKHLDSELKQSVIAQDNAVDTLVRAIRRNRIGLRNPNRPVGVFMFLGPTGVGKTYLAKRLAQRLFSTDDALIRIDMSEYTESFNTSRLIGAPPGYVGYEEGGQLTEQVRRHPYSIVLLDEIEKAHPAVFNMLLQVLDEGRLTDGNGRHIDFRNTIIIMTSNAGTRQLKEFGRGVGFNAGSLSDSLSDDDRIKARQIVQKALQRQFAPEFLNRLDEIITFDQLSSDAIRKIVDIELEELCERIGELGYTLNIDDTARDFIAQKGYDIQFGARPLKRALQTLIEDPVSQIIIEARKSPGDTITITLAEDKQSLSCE